VQPVIFEGNNCGVGWRDQEMAGFRCKNNAAMFGGELVGLGVESDCEKY
jgi:hypothetical protein